MKNGRLIIRHGILSLLFLVLFVVLNHPSVILIAQLGSVTWYPATGLVLALLLGISPWYFLLVAVVGVLPGVLFYHQPFSSFGQTIGNVGFAMIFPLELEAPRRRARASALQ